MAKSGKDTKPIAPTPATQTPDLANSGPKTNKNDNKHINQSQSK